VFRVGIFKAETSHIPGNKASVSGYIISPVDRFFYWQGSAANLSSPEHFSPSLTSLVPLSPLRFLLYNALFTRILLVDKFLFSFSLRVPARVAQWGTAIYFPPIASHGALAPFRSPRFGCLWSFAAVSSIARTSSLYADADPLSSRIRDGAATPMQRAPKGTDHTWSSRSFKSRGIRNCARPTMPAGDAAEVWRTNYQWSFCAFCLATRRIEVLNVLSREIAMQYSRFIYASLSIRRACQHFALSRVLTKKLHGLILIKNVKSVRNLMCMLKIIVARFISS